MIRRMFVFFVAAGPILGWAHFVLAQEAEDFELLKLKDHPRLWVPAETIDNLADKLHTAYMKSAAARILADADWLATAEPIAQNEVRTHMLATHLIGSHLRCLTSAYVLTREQKYRDAAMRHLANILNWRHISCEANINTPSERKMFFCLSYGVYSADVALMYDVFRPDITDAEMKIFTDVLDRYFLWQALRLSARGGSSRIRGHGHLDLLNFKCRINDETMIEDQKGGVGRGNFTGRGQDLYSRSPAAKSTLFVDGLGCGVNTEVSSTEVVEGEGLMGIRLDASRIYLPRWRGFIGRLFLLVDNRYWLVVDTAPGHAMEVRFHTYAELETGDDEARLEKGDERLTITFASLSGGVMQRSEGMPSTPAEQTKIMRWMSGSARDSLQVVALNPGTEKLVLELAMENDGSQSR